MATPFKSKRRPDNVSVSLSLDQHVSSDDPHSQYVLKRELTSGNINVNVSTLLSVISTKNELAEHTVVTTPPTFVEASLVKLLNSEAHATIDEKYTLVDNRVTDVYNDLDSQISSLNASVNTVTITVSDIFSQFRNHVRDGENDVKYTQSDALGDGGAVAAHVDNEGKNLYAARTHTHTLVGLGLNGVHESLLTSNVSLSTLFAPYVHDHDDRYPTRNELEQVGIFDHSVRSGGITIDVETDQEVISEEDLNSTTYLTQGNYYFGRDLAVLKNGPFGVTEGMLTVYSTSFDEYPITTYQMMYTDDMSWKRVCTTTAEEVSSVDPDTGETITSTQTTTSFTDWIPLVETAPIGSLMFNNGSTIVPKGYIEANGAETRVSSYPTLWKYVLENGALVTYSDWSTDMKGSYGLSETDTTRYVSTKVVSAADVDKVYVRNETTTSGKHFVKLTNSNTNQYVGKSCSFIDASILENYTTNEIVFRLPILGDRFLKMWTASSPSDVGAYESAGLPNITGTIGPVLEEGAYGSYTDGAFYQTQEAGTGHGGGSDYIVKMDASRCSSVYGNSDTVTPENVSVRVFIKAYNGALMKEDRSESQIRDIIADLIGTYQYATTSIPGIVRLATTNIMNGGADEPTQPSVVTATQFLNKDRENVKYIDIDGTVYTPVSGTVNLPKFAEMEGNRTAILTMQDDEHIHCTALEDTTPEQRYYDFVIPAEIADKLIDKEESDIFDSCDINVSLKCIDETGNNAFGYGFGTVISKPMTSNKSLRTSDEYLTAPYTVAFVDTVTYSEIRSGSNGSAYVTPKYIKTNDYIFEEGKAYYTKQGSDYIAVSPTPGTEIRPEGSTEEYYEQYGGGESDSKRLIVRLYWPLVWYIKKLFPAAGETSKVFPMTDITLSEVGTAIVPEATVLNAIAGQMQYWTAIVKVSL